MYPSVCIYLSTLANTCPIICAGLLRIISCILLRQTQLDALSLLGLYYPELVVCQAMDYLDSLRSLGQWLTDAAIGRQTAPSPLAPYSSSYPKQKSKNRWATLTPSPFLLSNLYLHALLNIVFSPALNKMELIPPLHQKSHSWDFGHSPFFSSIKIKSSSRLACFILLATTWQIRLVSDLSWMRKGCLLHTKYLVMGPTPALPRQLECTVTSQRQRSLAMFIVGRWKKSPVGISFSP